MTRCVPPFRSRPRRIGSGLFVVGMIATAKTTRTARISTTFHKQTSVQDFLQEKRARGYSAARRVVTPVIAERATLTFTFSAIFR